MCNNQRALRTGELQVAVSFVKYTDRHFHAVLYDAVFLIKNTNYIIVQFCEYFFRGLDLLILDDTFKKNYTYGGEQRSWYPMPCTVTENLDRFFAQVVSPVNLSA